MNWYTLQKYSEVSLYHGTIRDNYGSIAKNGLIPEIGQFIQDAYGSEYADAGIDINDHFTPLTFATDKNNLDRAVTAMKHHIANKLGKGFHDVTEMDIRNHGLVVKIKGSPGEAIPPSSFEQRPEDYDMNWEMEAEERGLHSAEPGDYYSEESTDNAKNKGIELIVGSALIRFLKNYGLLPSGKDKYPQYKNTLWDKQ